MVVSVQLASVDLLKLLEVETAKISAVSIGCFAKMYWEGKVSLEEVVRCVCYMGKGEEISVKLENLLRNGEVVW